MPKVLSPSELKMLLAKVFTSFMVVETVLIVLSIDASVLLAWMAWVMAAKSIVGRSAYAGAALNTMPPIVMPIAVEP